MKSYLILALLVCACSSGTDRVEGTMPGDCTDDADNDGDGLFDCADPSCMGAAVCGGSLDAGIDSGVPDAGPPPVGVDALWQVRCSPGVPGCVMGEDVIDLTAFDGQMTDIGGQMETVSVSCSLSDIENDTQILNVAISTRTMAGTQAHVLQVQNVIIAAGSGAVTGTGNVVIKADDIELEGAVGASPPSESTPCRISPVTFSEREEGPAVSFELECRNISNPANPALTQRDLTFPGMSSSPASINVFNCEGL